MRVITKCEKCGKPLRDIEIEESETEGEIFDFAVGTTQPTIYLCDDCANPNGDDESDDE